MSQAEDGQTTPASLQQKRKAGTKRGDKDGG